MRRGSSAASPIEAPAPASRAVRFSAVVETAETAIGIGTGGATLLRFDGVARTKEAGPGSDDTTVTSGGGSSAT